MHSISRKRANTIDSGPFGANDTWVEDGAQIDSFLIYSPTDFFHYCKVKEAVRYTWYRR